MKNTKINNNNKVKLKNLIKIQILLLIQNTKKIKIYINKNKLLKIIINYRIQRNYN